MKTILAFILTLATLAAGPLLAQAPKPNDKTVPSDPGWPRQRTNEQGRLVYYQPQVDEWKDFKELKFRMAFTLTPKGQKEIVGIIVLQAETDVSVDDRKSFFIISRLPRSRSRPTSRWSWRDGKFGGT